MGHQQTPSFQLELPLRADAGQAHHFLAHLEAAQRLYNAILGEAIRIPSSAARAIPRQQKKECASAFAIPRKRLGFTEYALLAFAKSANHVWPRGHIDAVLTQMLASRDYHAVKRE